MIPFVYIIEIDHEHNLSVVIDFCSKGNQYIVTFSNNMKSIYLYSDYRTFVADYLNSTRTRGLRAMTAKALSITPSYLSQVVSGDKSFTPEQALDFCEFLGLNSIHSDFFCLLVDYSRAGTERLRKKLKQQLEEKKKESMQISSLVSNERRVDLKQRVEYYSSWVYTGVRNWIAVEPENDLRKISKRLNIEVSQLQRVIKFLIENGFLVQKQNRYEVLEKNIHLSAEDRAMLSAHHRNWRIKGLQAFEENSDNDLFYTCPMSLSKEVESEVTEELRKMIQRINQKVGPSRSEIVKCLNIDWYNW